MFTRKNFSVRQLDVLYVTVHPGLAVALYTCIPWPWQCADTQAILWNTGYHDWCNFWREAISAIGHCQWCCNPALHFFMIGFGSDSAEEKANRVKFQEFALTRISTAVLWDVVLCSISDRYECLAKICCLTTLNLETAVSSETSLSTSVYIALRLLIPHYPNILRW
jgi:hypothetical protein